MASLSPPDSLLIIEPLMVLHHIAVVSSVARIIAQVRSVGAAVTYRDREKMTIRLEKR